MKSSASSLITILFSPPSPFWYELSFVAIDLGEILLASYLGISWQAILLFFISGIFLWSFVEYIIHRFVFHHRSQNKHVRKIVYAVHGIHHAHTKDTDKLYVPFVPAMLMKMLLLLLFYFTIGPIGFPLLAGLVTMHQFYNLIHYLIHTDAYPNNVFLNRLRNNHLKHHQGHGGKCFGVTTTLFDRLFGTYVH